MSSKFYPGDIVIPHRPSEAELKLPSGILWTRKHDEMVGKALEVFKIYPDGAVRTFMTEYILPGVDRKILLTFLPQWLDFALESLESMQADTASFLAGM